MTAEQVAELREAAFDYASLIQVERFDRNDVAVRRAYERLRQALDVPHGLPEGGGPRIPTADNVRRLFGAIDRNANSRE